MKELINEIWSLVKHTHGVKDYEDLKTFNQEELIEILNDIKQEII